MMNPIQSMAQYQNFVQQVLEVLGDLRAAIEYGEEFMGDALNFLDNLE
jgi:hypothetical protein